jgi:hypothetical protein
MARTTPAAKGWGVADQAVLQDATAEREDIKLVPELDAEDDGGRRDPGKRQQPRKEPQP